MHLVISAIPIHSIQIYRHIELYNYIFRFRDNADSISDSMQKHLRFERKHIPSIYRCIYLN